MNIPASLTLFFQHYGLLLLVSALLMLFYQALMAGKHSYRFQRLYLMGIPAVCAVQMGVWIFVPHLLMKQSPEVLTLTPTEAAGYFIRHSGNTVLVEDIQEGRMFVKAEEVSSKVQKEMPVETLMISLCVVASTVSVVLLLMVLIPLFSLWRKMRHLPFNISTADYKVLRASWVETPFSFGRIIFLPEGRAAVEETLFIRHECAHIVRRHFIDVWCIELLVRLLWFNPVLWFVRKTLRDLHEFEADHLVLEQGSDVYLYQCLLVSEVSGVSAIMTNGFAQSFVLRRIKEMKRTERDVLSRKGMVASIVWLFLPSAVITVCALPEKNAVIVHVKDEEVKPQEYFDTCVTSLSVVDAVSCGVRETEEKVPKNVLRLCQDTTDFEDLPSNNPTTEDDFPDNLTCVGDGLHKVYDLPLHDDDDSRRIWLEHRGDESHLTFVKTIRSDNEPVRFGGSDSYIVDVATGIYYKARRSIPAEAWHKFRVCGMKGKKIKVTVVFPRIPEKVHWISLYQITGDAQSGDRLKVEDLSQ